MYMAVTTYRCKHQDDNPLLPPCPLHSPPAKHRDTRETSSLSNVFCHKGQ